MKTIDRVAPSEVMLMAMEVSVHKWLLGFSNGERRWQHEVPAWDITGTREAVQRGLHERGYPAGAAVRCCYEASRDGFSIHRMLAKHHIRTWVLDPASIEVSRRRRRNKTDRLDLNKLLDVHESYA